MFMAWWVPIMLLSLSTAACHRQPPQGELFAQLAEEAVYTGLALSPVAATSVGYHIHKDPDTGTEVRLDERLDDWSAEGIERQRRFYQNLRDRLNRLETAGLSPDERADYDILQDSIALNLLELDDIQNWRHNPTVYVESIGSALFTPHVLDYAPKEQRLRHIMARMEKIPSFLEQARANLRDAPEIWTTVAIEENGGNISLIDQVIRAGAPEAMRADYDRAAQAALAALRAFQDYLKGDLAKRNQWDWRLGPEKYGRKFRYALGTDLTPQQVLERAEADVRAVRARMYDLALPLHQKMYPGKRDRSDPQRVVAETLDRIADRHATPATYIPDARRDLEEARQFVRERNLLPLPPRDNLLVIETPEFLRGIYAVGGFMPAPALEPQLGAFYWITPIPPAWPRQRVESKLREYNFYKLKLLTIHEAIPGHYVQLEYANDIQPQTRRILRAVFGNGPYVEGWAQYATQVMLDEGFLNNSPELRLTFLKEELRVLANAILDIRLHSMGMTDQQALDLMEKDTFQEHEEAAAKLRRAKLSSCQLPTYFVGWRDWLRVREHYRQAKGASYRLPGFHSDALQAGAVPLPVLARLLTGSSLPGAN
jgi:uncharacterized protein (DUF885 family)